MFYGGTIGNQSLYLILSLINSNDLEFENYYLLFFLSLTRLNDDIELIKTWTEKLIIITNI